MLVCDKCFRPKCNCNSNSKIEIDDRITEHIRILNEKGYTTEFCCSGHKENQIFQCYVLFKNQEHFLDLPKDFTLYNRGKQKKNRLLEFVDKKWNKKSDSSKDLTMETVWNNLYTWCLKLPNKNEMEKEWIGNI